MQDIPTFNITSATTVPPIVKKYASYSQYDEVSSLQIRSIHPYWENKRDTSGFFKAPPPEEAWPGSVSTTIMPNASAALLDCMNPAKNGNILVTNLPGRTALGCRKHYWKYLVDETDKEKRTRLASVYERYGFKSLSTMVTR